MLLQSRHPRPHYSQLIGSSDALALAQYAAQHSPLAVIAANALEAQRLLEEIPFFAPDLRVHLLPDWETLPYDHFSPHQDLISERLATLHQIRTHACDVVVVPITTALYPLPPVSYLAAYTFFLKRGDKLDLNGLREQMTLAGYTHVQQVLTPGEYCVRGGLIDLFPMGSALPYRIDLFDDEIETVATFDVDTQRTLYPVPEIRLLPAREFPLDEKGQANFRQRFRERFEGDPSKSRIYKDVSKGIAPNGIEYYLPLFFEQTATLLDYLPANATLCLHHDIDTAIRQFTQDAASRYNLLRGDPQRPLLEPKELFLDGEQFFIRLKEFARLDIAANASEGANLTVCPTAAIPAIAVNRRADIPTQAFQDFLQDYRGRVLLLADSLGRREIMAEYLQGYGLNPALCENYAGFLAAKEKFMLSVATLGNGFILTKENLAIVTESELYAQQARTRASRAAKKSNVESMLRDLSELKPGDPVVHEQHGIARYRGLMNLDLGEGENEFLLLEYAGN
ncbi:MAG: transcription-repair coupling factor, partial [Gallionella sp.]|nr:transcription-repair coupling factor [Gallionella sp.]